MLSLGGGRMCVLAPKRRVAWMAVMAMFCGAQKASAANAGAPLFNAFKSFCSDTGARADDVKRAVLAAGGAPHDPPTRSVETPYSMQTTHWAITAGGHA